MKSLTLALSTTAGYAPVWWPLQVLSRAVGDPKDATETTL